MKNLFVSLLILLASFSVKAQNSNLPYSEKDYLVTMNKVVSTLNVIYNANDGDTTSTQRLMDLSCNEVYVLSWGFMDQDTTATYAIKEWFIPTIKNLSNYLPTKVVVVEQKPDKWGVWFSVKATNVYGDTYIDFGINRENKITSIVL